MVKEGDLVGISDLSGLCQMTINNQCGSDDQRCASSMTSQFHRATVNLTTWQIADQHSLCSCDKVVTNRQ
jgi:hypothetical protein